MSLDTAGANNDPAQNDVSGAGSVNNAADNITESTKGALSNDLESAGPGQAEKEEVAELHELKTSEESASTLTERQEIANRIVFSLREDLVLDVVSNINDPQFKEDRNEILNEFEAGLSRELKRSAGIIGKKNKLPPHQAQILAQIEAGIKEIRKEIYLSYADKEFVAAEISQSETLEFVRAADLREKFMPNISEAEGGPSLELKQEYLMANLALFNLLEERYDIVDKLCAVAEVHGIEEALKPDARHQAIRDTFSDAKDYIGFIERLNAAGLVHIDSIVDLAEREEGAVDLGFRYQGSVRAKLQNCARLMYAKKEAQKAFP